MSADDDNTPPFDIQIEIMKRLPIKSLLKFRSVSKPWKSIIQSSEFITDYNHHHTHHCNHQKLLVGSQRRRYVDIFADDDDNFPKGKSRLPLPSLASPYTCDMIGYSQGLFCFFNYDESQSFFVIWNPSIRKSVDIPVPHLLGRPYHPVFGFGVRNATDPIIVKISFIDDDKFDTTSSTPWQVEVFTLSTGVWRSLSNSKCLPRISLNLTMRLVVIDKFIYWLAFDEGLDDYPTLILSFDVTSEEFKEIYLPPILAHTPCIELKLSKLRESLVVLQTIYWEEEDKSMYDVWMREDGVQNSFKKLYTVKPPSASIQCVLGFRNNGQPIIERGGYDETRLFVYEPDLECFNNIGILGIRSFSCFAGSYMGTLLLLDH